MPATASRLRPPARINPMLKPAIHQLGENDWLVTETAQAGGLYQVRRYQGNYTCTCPDHRYRNRHCRHILAVLEQQSGDPEPPDRMTAKRAAAAGN